MLRKSEIYTLWPDFNVISRYQTVMSLSYNFSRYNVFCPYAYKENGTVRSHDLASNYNCHDPRAEWYYTLKIRDYSNLTVVTDKTSYRSVLISIANLSKPRSLFSIWRNVCVCICRNIELHALSLEFVPSLSNAFQ